MKEYKIIGHYVRVKFDDGICDGIAMYRIDKDEYKVYFPDHNPEWNTDAIRRNRIIAIGPKVTFPPF